MIAAHIFNGQKIGVLGLGRTGLATARALSEGGAEVFLWDDSAAKREEAKNAGFQIRDFSSAGVEGFAALVVSPGVPFTHPAPHTAIVRARAQNVEIIGDIEIFARLIAAAQPKPKIVGVTGTNGKSTTTTLIGHLLKEAGLKVAVGGNIGFAVLDLEPLSEVQVYVLELSSYQLDLTESLKPNVSVLLNITPDHIDRHGDMDGYIAAKMRIFARQSVGDVAVVGIDDLHTADICTGICGGGEVKPIPVSVGKTLSRGVFVIDGVMYDGTASKAGRVCDLKEFPRLPGAHNWQNAAAAYATGRALGVDAAILSAGLKNFRGLAHRMEEVGSLNGIRFINDSKATNAEAAARALGSYDRIYWIAGGRPKTGGIGTLEPYFNKIAKAYLIGEAADAFARTLEGKVIYEKCGVIEKAVDRAVQDAMKDGRKDVVVLLSPACASFDQFTDFEARGEAFRHAVNAHVNALPKRGAGGA